MDELFSKSTPSPECSRSSYPFPEDAPHEVISLDLVANAGEAAGDDTLFESWTESQKQSVADMLNRSSLTRSMGAALHCARVIGRGDCPTYIYDDSEKTIVERPTI